MNSFINLSKSIWLNSSLNQEHLLCMEQNAGAASQINSVNMWLLWDAVRDSAQRFPRGAERWQSFYAWLTTQTCSVPTSAASGSLRQTWPWREGLYYGALAPVVHNFFTTRKCQRWSFFFFKFHPKISLLITRLSSWLRLLGKLPPSRIQKHVCAISHPSNLFAIQTRR